MRTTKQTIETIQHTPSLAIRNLDALPSGVGARYLEVIRGEGADLVAKQWRRKVPQSGIVVDFKPIEKASDPTDHLDQLKQSLQNSLAAVEKWKQERAQVDQTIPEQLEAMGMKLTDGPGYYVLVRDGHDVVKVWATEIETCDECEHDESHLLLITQADEDWANSLAARESYSSATRGSFDGNGQVRP